MDGGDIGDKAIEPAMSATDKPTHSEFGEGYDCVARDYRKLLQRFDDALVFKGLSFVEAYIKGRARIAVEFRAHAIGEADSSRLISVWHHEGHIRETASGGVARSVKDVQPLDFHDGIGCNQNMVLVGNVKPVDAVKVIPANLERLYFIQDELDNCRAGEGSCFLSIKGGFRILPCVSERELSPSVDGPAIGLDEGTVSVVQGCAEIMDGVPHDGRSMARNASAEGSLFPSVRVGLRPEGFNVFHHVGPDNRFELLDVMVGPFYF